MDYGKDSVVTVDLGTTSSNVFVVDTVEDNKTTILVSHPLAKDVLLRVSTSKINNVSALIKDSSERSIDYANGHSHYLDYNTNLDLESIGLFFAMKRKLSSGQKQTIANICGKIANIKYNNDVKLAMAFISKNKSLLDDFNLLWFNNFKDLFSGKQEISSIKQRSAIFNMAGHVLAEMENPTARSGR